MTYTWDGENRMGACLRPQAWRRTPMCGRVAPVPGNTGWEHAVHLGWAERAGGDDRGSAGGR
jgi:hypothetical protein